MCGIFALLNVQDLSFDNCVIHEQFMRGKNRGPEFSKLDSAYHNSVLGFHRLAINGLNSNSNQPIKIKGVSLVCNGEIYNYKELYETMQITPTTNSDCEVIIHLFLKYGIEQTLNMLDGVFAFILYDSRNVNSDTVYVARDPIGVRPLYMWNYANSHKDIIGFASEMKMLNYFHKYNSDFSDKNKSEIFQFTPGSYSVYTTPKSEYNSGHYSVYMNQKAKMDDSWKTILQNKLYFIPSFAYTKYVDASIFKSNHISNEYYITINSLLNNAVVKRCTTTERKVACLVSGGIDSSLIAALVANYFRGKNMTIETYSIGLEGSDDLKYAKMVADYIQSEHHEIIVTENDMYNAIHEVIEAIESYDTTTVRASIGNYLIGKYIATHSEAKVIFNGDGSDELFGGYLYMHKCPDDIEFDKESRSLLRDIHLFDVLRSDKSISSNGLEPRTPFLDKSLVNYVLSIPPYIRNHNNYRKQEKHLLRYAFGWAFFSDNLGRQILPDEILLRKKEAFSDGVSSKTRSLFEILQEKIANDLNKNLIIPKYEANIDTEKMHYREIFNQLYENCENILPYYWMPKYTNAIDPSARTLNFYV